MLSLPILPNTGELASYPLYSTYEHVLRQSLRCLLASSAFASSIPPTIAVRVASQALRLPTFVVDKRFKVRVFFRPQAPTTGQNKVQPVYRQQINTPQQRKDACAAEWLHLCGALRNQPLVSLVSTEHIIRRKRPCTMHSTAKLGETRAVYMLKINTRVTEGRSRSTESVPGGCRTNAG